MEQVWLTGVGATTTLGNSYREVADNLLAGRSGIERVSSFPVEQHPSQIGARLDEVPCPEGWDAAEFPTKNRVEQAALWCCVQALRDAGVWHERSQLRIGLILGVGSEWLLEWEANALAGGDLVEQPGNEPAPHLQVIQKALDLHGPSLMLSTACASGNHALTIARHWLRNGWADLCLAGACDMNVTPMVMAAFGNLRALSRRNDAPQQASRPFDKDRDGFVIGEGGVMFVLEPEGRARQRSAHVYGELAGCGASSDAFHMVIPGTDPAYPAAAIRRALAAAGLDSDDVDYVNAHGTATPIGDVGEARVLQTIFGDRVKEVPVSSTKSMTGHLLTAASALEALACLAALEGQAVPPTINLDHPDPECDLCHVPHEAQPRPVRVAISNAFGFGGSNSCAVFRAV